jgi:hypothetical protein
MAKIKKISQNKHSQVLIFTCALFAIFAGMHLSSLILTKQNGTTYIAGAVHVSEKLDSGWEVIQVNPLNLNLKNCFGIIVKTAYAIFLCNCNVPTFVTEMYNQHLEQVWNKFKELCVFVGDKDWFNAKIPCVKKSSAQDFLSMKHFFKQTGIHCEGWF